MLKSLEKLRQQEAVEAVEVEVTTKSVTDEIDFGETKIQRCAKGFLFTAKGGLQTLVSWRMERVCKMCETLFYYRDYAPKEEEAQKLVSALTNAILYVFQAPIFASLNEQTLVYTATDILRRFNDAAEAMIDSAEPSEETEEDVKANIKAENEDKALAQLVDEAAKLPNYDEE